MFIYLFIYYCVSLSISFFFLSCGVVVLYARDGSYIHMYMCIALYCLLIRTYIEMYEYIIMYVHVHTSTCITADSTQLEDKMSVVR